MTASHGAKAIVSYHIISRNKHANSSVNEPTSKSIIHRQIPWHKNDTPFAINLHRKTRAKDFFFLFLSSTHKKTTHHHHGISNLTVKLLHDDVTQLQDFNWNDSNNTRLPSKLQTSRVDPYTNIMLSSYHQTHFSSLMCNSYKLQIATNHARHTHAHTRIHAHAYDITAHQVTRRNHKRLQGQYK